MLCRVWDLRNGHCLFVLEGHASRINGLAMGHEGKWCATASDDGSVRLWDLRKGSCKQVLQVRRRRAVGEAGGGVCRGGGREGMGGWGCGTCGLLGLPPRLLAPTIRPSPHQSTSSPSYMQQGQLQGCGAAGAGHLWAGLSTVLPPLPPPPQTSRDWLTSVAVSP